VTGDAADLARRYGVIANGVTTPLGNPNEVNNWSTRVRGHINFDARTQTDIGLVRAYIAMEGTRGPRNVTPGDNTPPILGVGAYSSNVTLSSAFIQVSNDWGTYTAGKFGSFFDFFGGDLPDTRIGLEAGTTDPNLFAWTFAGGNGFSFSVSAEDPDSTGRRRNGDDDYEGLEAPDGVANIRVDQGWGSAQIMGAVRHINDDNGDGIGWAIGGGLRINVPGGWYLVGQGGYSEGAVAYVSADPGRIGDFNGPTGDQQNEAWGGRGGIGGTLMEKLTARVEGSFYHYEEDDNGDDYDFWALLAGASYEAAPGLTMGPTFGYNNFDGDDANEDYDIWGVMWRIQRSF
jgi:hypothetical protein